MHKLFRSMSRDNRESGVSLPYVFQSFKDNGIKFFPGDLTMFAGPPGAGKSTLALNYALEAKIQTLYISSDMPRYLVARRLCAIKTDTEVNTVAEEMQTTEGFEKYRSVLEGIDHIYMDYPARPDAEAVARAQMAFMEIHGVPSPLMVVDNLMNLHSPNAPNEWAGLRELSQVLKYFVTELEIVVLVLHHTSLGAGDLSRPPAESFIMGKVTELPSTILTLGKKPGELLYSPVKNRHGKADAMANIVLPLAYDEEKQIISDPKKEDVFQPKTAIAHKHEVYQDWRERAYKD